MKDLEGFIFDSPNGSDEKKNDPKKKLSLPYIATPG